MHLIAQKLHQKNSIKWIADFRDPWTDLYYNANFKQTFFAKKRNKKLENLVLTNADCVLTVSNTLKKEFFKTAQQVEVITNGFDDEFVKLPLQKREKQFTISYIGLLPKESNPSVLFKVLKKLCAQDPLFSDHLKLNFIGDIAPEVKQEVAIQGLTEKVNFIGRVSHEKAIAYQQKAQVLLLLIPNVKKSEGILTHGVLTNRTVACNRFLSFCSLEMVLSNLIFSVSTRFLALLIMLYGIPFFCATSKVNELPACPINSLYKGSKERSSNCMLALVTFSNSFANTFKLE